MKKKIFLTLGVVLLISRAFAQENEASGDKKLEHYIGFQVNELVRSVLNLSNSNSISNPYFLIYALNSAKSGWGIDVGAGYTYSQDDQGDALTPQSTVNENASFRLGSEKKFKWGNHWVFLMGIDALYSHKMTKQTTTVIGFPGQLTETNVVSETEAVGAGIRGGIYYAFNKRILLGTETNYSFLLDKNTFTSGVATQENTKKNLGFTAPVALFLTVRF